MDPRTRYTFSFIHDQVKLQGLKVLEVGCGSGELGVELSLAGADYMGIDSDRRLVGIAVSRGLDVRSADATTFKTSQRFDLILWTRSLHHIHQLDQSIENISSMLAPGGIIILEEMDLDHVDDRTLKWYYKDQMSTADQLAHKWHSEHDHDPPLHKGKDMVIALKRVDQQLQIERCAYLFRNLIDSTSDADQEFMLGILNEEEQLILQGEILPVGLRVTARSN